MRKVLSFVLCIILCVSFFTFSVSAANYSSDYRYWSQGASSNSKMDKYGCWVVAQAKLIYESGVDRSSGFNPDTYMTWEQNNGYLNSNFNQVNGVNAPVAYANSKGKTLSYLGSTSSSVESKIWDNISKGYWSIIYVKTSSGGDHYVMVANSLSSQNGVLYCYNSYVGYSSASPTTISARGYTIKSVYTYSGSGSSASASVTFTSLADKNTITDSNAIVWAQVNKPSSQSVSKIGIKVRKDGSTYEKGWSKYESPSRSYAGDSYMQIYYNFNTELNFTPTHATKYWIQFYAQVNGTDYWSDEYYITTTGSHSYSSWSTTKAATCTAAGSKKRSCSCGKTETASIAALGHSYSDSWTIDKVATCTAEGSKSYHCTRCDAKKSVTAISATGHSWGVWNTVTEATCTTAGKQERKCASCSQKETKSIAATGHSYSNNYTTDKSATCTQSGTRSKHCSDCSARTDITTINATGHNWGEFTVTVQATTEKQGTAVRKCQTSGCGATETKTLPKLASDGHTHSFGEWTVKTEATCLNNGAQERICTVCSEKEEQILSALGHSFGEWSAADSNGNVKRVCEICGGTQEENNGTVIKENKESETEKKKETSATKKDTSESKSSIVVWIVGGVLLLGVAVLIVVLIKKK